MCPLPTAHCPLSRWVLPGQGGPCKWPGSPALCRLGRCKYSVAASQLLWLAWSRMRHGSVAVWPSACLVPASFHSPPRRPRPSGREPLALGSGEQRLRGNFPPACPQRPHHSESPAPGTCIPSHTEHTISTPSQRLRLQTQSAGRARATSHGGRHAGPKPPLELKSGQGSPGQSQVLWCLGPLSRPFPRYGVPWKGRHALTMAASSTTMTLALQINHLDTRSLSLRCKTRHVSIALC